MPKATQLPRGVRSEGSEESSGTKKRERGKRTPAATARRLANYVAGSRRNKLSMLESVTKEYTLGYYPDEFIHVPTNSKKVLQIYRKQFPGEKPADLELAPTHGRLKFIPPPSDYDSDASHPPFLALRFDQIWQKPNHETEILNAWDTLKEAGVKFPPPDKSRSLSPGLHFGIWRRFWARPFISGDTRNQTPDVIAKIDIFLELIQSYIAPRILSFLKDEFPVTYELYQRARKSVLESLDAEIGARPCLDFLGAFFTVAAKEGSSEKLHLDFTDPLNGISFVVPVSDDQWEGGHFCSPQLGHRIPIGRGQALAVRTRLLLHCGSPVTRGRRLVLTLFCDRNLLNGL